MTSPNASIELLPSEILDSIFNSFSTLELLPAVAVCRRFQTVISHIIEHRLQRVAPLPENQLILECYPPSDKISTPYLSCTFLRTKALAGSSSSSLAFTGLRRTYSSFRPVIAEENRPRRWRSPSSLSGSSPAPDTASQVITLDEGELFSQLCAVTNLMKQGHKPGFFLSHLNISDGVVRVWREWLAEKASVSADHVPDSEHLSEEDSNILWVDTTHGIGLRFRVSPLVAVTPVLLGPGDEPPVTYTLVYEEMLVRTSKLLLAVERSQEMEVAHHGKAVMIAAI